MMADTKCFCSAEFCGHEGRCGKPVEFSVKTQAYQGSEVYGPERRLGICEECFGNMQKQIPGFFGDDR
jgi:hypothetical protein